MAFSVKFLQDITYVELIFTIIIAWILIALWQRCIDNFTFGYLGINENSAFHTLIIALVFSILFFVFVFTFEGFSIFLNNGFAPGIPTLNSPKLDPETENN